MTINHVSIIEILSNRTRCVGDTRASQNFIANVRHNTVMDIASSRLTKKTNRALKSLASKNI